MRTRDEILDDFTRQIAGLVFQAFEAGRKLPENMLSLDVYGRIGKEVFVHMKNGKQLLERFASELAPIPPLPVKPSANGSTQPARVKT